MNRDLHGICEKVRDIKRQRDNITRMNDSDKLEYLNKHGTELNFHCSQNPNTIWSLSNPIATWSPDLPKIRYASHDTQDKTVVHWGQRKLLLTEVDFLTQFINENPKSLNENYTFIYAGAAPAMHTPLLVSLFPEFEFILVDPNRFLVEPSDRMHLIVDYFTDDMARYFASKYDNILFCSDVRSFFKNATDVQQQERVDIDNHSQMTWHNLLGSKKSILKFRPPFNLANDSTPGATAHRVPNMYRCLDGQIRIQPFAPQTSSESRLWADKGLRYKEYNDVTYDDTYYYFNRNTRPTCYVCNPRLIDIAGFDYCYDCVREYDIWTEYCKLPRRKGKIEPLDLIGMTNQRLHAHKVPIRYEQVSYVIDFYNYRFGQYMDIGRFLGSNPRFQEMANRVNRFNTVIHQ